MCFSSFKDMHSNSHLKIFGCSRVKILVHDYFFLTHKFFLSTSFDEENSPCFFHEALDF